LRRAAVPSKKSDLSGYSRTASKSLIAAVTLFCSNCATQVNCEVEFSLTFNEQLGGNAVQVSTQELLCLTFEFFEHDAVAELGMAGGDAAMDDNREIVEPEGGSNVSAYGEGHHQLDVAAGAT
jgi:hypothetical protein